MKKRILIYAILLDALIGQCLHAQTYYWPVVNGPATLTSAFGPRNKGRQEYPINNSVTDRYEYDFHPALDLAIHQIDNEVVPVLSGIVDDIGGSGVNTYVTIEHTYPGESTTFLCTYTHITPTAGLEEGNLVIGGLDVIGNTLCYNGGNDHTADHLDLRYFPDGIRADADMNGDNPGKILTQTPVGAGLTISTSEPLILNGSETVLPETGNQLFLEADPTDLFGNQVNARYFVIGARIPKSALSINSIKVSLCGYYNGDYLDEHSLLKNTNATGTYEFEEPHEVTYYVGDHWETYESWTVACGDNYDGTTTSRDDGHNSSAVGIYPRRLQRGDTYHTVYFRWYVNDNYWSYMNYINATIEVNTWVIIDNKPLGITRYNIPIGRTISGYITSDGTRSGSPISGVIMRNISYEPNTDATGKYNAIVPDGWSGTATPEFAKFSFDPPNKIYTNITTDQTSTNEDYRAIQNTTYTISGYVRTAELATIKNVHMSGLPIDTYTDDNGFYSITVSSGWTGTVIPVLAGYSFQPYKRDYSMTEDKTTEDYTGSFQTGPKITISGTVLKSNGSAMSGVMIIADGNPMKSTYTVGDGTYSIEEISPWTGTIIPMYSGYSFTPSSIALSGVTTNQTAKDFTGYNTAGSQITISGTIRKEDGSAIPNVTVMATGTPINAIKNTNEYGQYTLILTKSWSGTVYPILSGYSFSPASQVYDGISSDQSKDYTGKVVTSTEPNIQVLSIQPSEVPYNAREVIVNITYSNQLKYPNCSCAALMRVYIDGEQRSYVDPLKSGTHKFSYSLSSGTHIIHFDQNECGADITPSEHTKDYYYTFIVTDGPIPVKMDQLGEGSVRIGKLGTWNGSIFDHSIDPGTTVPFDRDATPVIRGDVDLIQGQKFHHWDYVYSDVINPKVFPIRIDFYRGYRGKTLRTEITSNFKPTTEGSTIKIDLIDVPGNCSGQIKFKDPWFMDFPDPAYGNNKRNQGIIAPHIPRSTPFSPNLETLYDNIKYKGVFPQQRPEIEGIFYSVQASLTQSLSVNNQSYSSVFVDWNYDPNKATLQQAEISPLNYDQKAVIFKQTDAKISARYKGHLITSISTATTGNSPRKVAHSMCGETGMHAVYCSGSNPGSVWYTHQNTDGTWAPEIKIGDGKNPSITVTSPDIVHIAWEKSSGYYQTRVNYRRSIDAGVTWGDPLVFTGKELYGGYDANPIVCGHRKALIVWRYGQAGIGGLYAVFDPSGECIENQIVSDFNAQSPSGVEAGYLLNSNQPLYLYHLIYQNGTGGITYNKVYAYSPPLSVIANQTLSVGPSPTSGNINPVIANDPMPTNSPAWYVGVAWENNTSHRIYYRESYNDAWGSVNEITHGSEILSKPTLGTYYQTIGQYQYPASVLLFHCGTQIGKTSKLSGSLVWSSIIHIGKGIGTQLPTFYYNDASIENALWTSGSSSPYQISTKQVNVSQQVSGTIGSNTTWSGVITVAGDVTVNSGVTLTITPGTSVAFSGGTTMLLVNGVLNAQGTASDPIQFTSVSGASKGSWNAVKVQNGNSIFKYCIFEYAQNGLYLNNATSGNRIWIENCKFLNSVTGVYVSQSNVTIKSCEIANNSYGVWCTTTSDVKLVGDSIHHNTYRGINSTSGNVVQLYGTVIQLNGTYGLYTASSDVVRLGQPYNWEGYNTIRKNGSTELCAFSGNPAVSIVTSSIHDSLGTEVYNYSGNQQLYTSNCYWDVNDCQYVGNVFFNVSNKNVPTWDGFTRIAGSPLGKSAPPIVPDSLPWIFDPNVPVVVKVGRCKDLIAKFPQSEIAKTALVWLYSMVREDYLNNELGEKEKFFSYVRSLKQNFATTDLGKQALRYMIVWKILENNDEAVIKLSQESLRFLSGEDRFWSAVDLARAFTRTGRVQEAKHILQELKANQSFDQELIEDIDREVNETEMLLAKGEVPMQKDRKSQNEDLGLLTDFALKQNYPNPYNPSTTINYQLPVAGNVKLVVFDMLGREVSTLADGVKESGYYSATFDGSHLSSGVYFVRFSVIPQDGSVPYVKTMKMLLTK